MKYRFLGRSGIRVSEICFGVMTFGGKGKWENLGAQNQRMANELVDMAIDKGVNFFDTADVYSEGESEIILGKALGPRRKDVVIATKCGFLTGKYSREEWPKGTRIRSSKDLLPLDLDRGFTIIDKMRSLKSNRNVTVTQIALNYLLKKPGITSVIIGARSKVQLLDNLATADWQLSDDEMVQLDKVSEPTKIYPHWYFDIFRKGRMDRHDMSE